jgi:hypothetical protein
VDLRNIINRKNEMADYMVEDITKIIKTFDKRPPGSKGEKEAVDYMASELKNWADDVKVESFTLHPGAFMGWIYLLVPLIVAGYVSYFFQPILTIPFILLGIIIMLFEFILYRQFVDKLYKKKTSYNITAVKKPTGEVKRRIFYNGHPDAAPEWTFNYLLGGVGFVGHVAICMVGVIYMLAIAVVSILNNAGVIAVAATTIRTLGMVALVFAPFWILLLWLWNDDRVVDGANDNLSGCYMGMAILKAMSEAGITLENTEVGVLITGSEEAGLRGAKAWSEAHKGEYEDAETIIFAYDTIHELKHLCVNVRDLNLTVKAHDRPSKLFKDAADELGVPCFYGNVPLGATDSAAFNQGGFKATGITGLNHNLQDYYHTRRDTYDNLDKECLAECYAASVKALELLDDGK